MCSKLLQRIFSVKLSHPHVKDGGNYLNIFIIYPLIFCFPRYIFSYKVSEVRYVSNVQ